MDEFSGGGHGLTLVIGERVEVLGQIVVVAAC